MENPTRVALFATCIVDQILPEVGIATVKVLRRAGCQVDFPSEQTCCGQPFFNSGFRKQAAGLAKRTIEIFEDQEAIVLPSGSCTTMIRLEYPELLAEEPEWQQRAERLGAKTFELSEFLTQQLGWEPAAKALAEKRTGGQSASGEESRPVTYHDSCHMKRLLKLENEPRQLLLSVGCSLHEMAEADRCCGFGGVFSARMPEVSSAMTAEKLRQAEETAATTIVTADPGCLMQMRGLSSPDGPSLQHLAQTLEEMTR
jgi:L-lactate dehydrogenase complex protein LldE